MYSTDSLADRIRTTAKSKNITMKELLLDAGLGKNVISHLISGSMLKADSLAKIADRLDVSVDYLLGRTDKPEINR